MPLTDPTSLKVDTDVLMVITHFAAWFLHFAERLLSTNCSLLFCLSFADLPAYLPTYQPPTTTTTAAYKTKSPALQSIPESIAFGEIPATEEKDGLGAMFKSKRRHPRNKQANSAHNDSNFEYLLVLQLNLLQLTTVYCKMTKFCL